MENFRINGTGYTPAFGMPMSAFACPFAGRKSLIGLAQPTAARRHVDGVDASPGIQDCSP